MHSNSQSPHATELAGQALNSGRGIMELVRERELLNEAQIEDILSPANMTGVRPGRR